MLQIADKQFSSRLFTGTGKFATPALMLEAIRASGSQLVTMAMKRLDLRGGNDNILAPLQASGVQLLPRLAREALGTHWLKLEIHPDARYLLPDAIETLKAAQQLVKEGFTVLPYCGADPVLCKRLEEAGCAAVMPLGAPIGSNQGLKTRDLLEMGADAVLVNTAIAVARDPVEMARAFRLAVEAGRLAWRSGLGASQIQAAPSSPLTAFLSQPEETR